LCRQRAEADRIAPRALEQRSVQVRLRAVSGVRLRAASGRAPSRSIRWALTLESARITG
jgi:hypothetical protein